MSRQDGDSRDESPESAKETVGETPSPTEAADKARRKDFAPPQSRTVRSVSENNLSPATNFASRQPAIVFGSVSKRPYATGSSDRKPSAKSSDSAQVTESVFVARRSDQVSTTD